ncbi:ketopantoate reductase family protein [Dactylosporangium sp. NPDC051541]|uniref:ketopantoate reductase family protein n=1 Tax=Dactylosporangium sp. NPDC051541 TaxID=3363977 RepID=UPI00378795C5
MKLLVYGAGVLGSLFAVQMQEAGHDVALLARGARLASLREDGVQLAIADSPDIRRVPVPVVEAPSDGYDLTTVFVRTHQVDELLPPLAKVDGDVLFLLNWAAGFEPLRAALGHDRVLLGFGTGGGTMDGNVIRYRPPNFLTRLITMSIDGTSPRLDHIIEKFRASGIKAKHEPKMDAWLKTHAAFEVPLGRAVHAAGGPAALSEDPAAVRRMLSAMRESLPPHPYPRAFNALRTLPEALLVPVLRRFLGSQTVLYSGLDNTSPAAAAEYDRLAEQLRAL